MGPGGRRLEEESDKATLVGGFVNAWRTEMDTRAVSFYKWSQSFLKRV